MAGGGRETNSIGMSFGIGGLWKEGLLVTIFLVSSSEQKPGCAFLYFYYVIDVALAHRFLSPSFGLGSLPVPPPSSLHTTIL